MASTPIVQGGVLGYQRVQISQHRYVHRSYLREVSTWLQMQATSRIGGSRMQKLKPVRSEGSSESVGRRAECVKLRCVSLGFLETWKAFVGDFFSGHDFIISET